MHVKLDLRLEEKRVIAVFRMRAVFILMITNTQCGAHHAANSIWHYFHSHLNRSLARKQRLIKKGQG